MEELNCVSSTSRLHKLLAKDKTNKLGTLKRFDEATCITTYTSNEKESLKLMSEVHFLDSNILEEDTIEDISPATPDNTKFYLSLCGNFSKNIVDYAIESFSPYKAVGKDGIFTTFLQ